MCTIGQLQDEPHIQYLQQLYQERLLHARTFFSRNLLCSRGALAMEVYVLLQYLTVQLTSPS